MMKVLMHLYIYIYIIYNINIINTFNSNDFYKNNIYQEIKKKNFFINFIYYFYTFHNKSNF